MNTSDRVITLQIDGQDVSAPEGQTILKTAADYHIQIPTLCHLDGLKDVGACRLCLVELNGWSDLVPACVTACRSGMEVCTESETLRENRKMIVELLLAEGNHVCSVCSMNGQCELQRLAQRLGVDHVEVPYRYHRQPVDASHPRFIFDPNRCVLCTRCIRACEQLEGGHNWGIMGRGINARLVIDFNRPWGQSNGCTSCGKCVRVCPTGALIDREVSAEKQGHEREYLPFLATSDKR